MTSTPWDRFLNVALLGQVALVDLAEDAFDDFNGPWLLKMAADLPDHQVYLDCGKVASLGDAGRATLSALHARLRAGGGGLTLHNVGPSLSAALEGVGLAELLDVRPQEEGLPFF